MSNWVNNWFSKCCFIDAWNARSTIGLFATHDATSTSNDAPTDDAATNAPASACSSSRWVQLVCREVFSERKKNHFLFLLNLWIHETWWRFSFHFHPFFQSNCHHFLIWKETFLLMRGFVIVFDFKCSFCCKKVKTLNRNEKDFPSKKNCFTHEENWFETQDCVEKLVYLAQLLTIG